MASEKRNRFFFYFWRFRKTPPRWSYNSVLTMKSIIINKHFSYCFFCDSTVKSHMCSSKNTRIVCKLILPENILSFYIVRSYYVLTLILFIIIYYSIILFIIVFDVHRKNVGSVCRVNFIIHRTSRRKIVSFWRKPSMVF